MMPKCKDLNTSLFNELISNSEDSFAAAHSAIVLEDKESFEIILPWRDSHGIGDAC